MSKASKRNPHNIPLANNFNNQLSNTYRKYLADKQNGNDQQLVNKKFIEDLTSFIGIASNCGREVSVAELKYLKLFWLNYNEILNNPLHKATVQDIKNLASYSAEQWLPAAQQVELTQTLFYIQDKAINLQLGDVKYCNRILENIEQWWSIPATGLDVVRLIERRFNKVALIKYKKYKFDENISKEKIEGNIFLAACRSHNKEYLDEVITEFSLNLATLQIPTTAENYWIQPHNTERTQTPLEGLTFITPSTGLLYITNKAFKKDYANLIFKEKRIHPDSDQYRADFSKLNYMTTLMLCSVSKDFEEAQENASLLIEFGADVNLVAENHLGIPRTAASFAMGNTNYKLLEYLGEQGADLGKAPNILGEIVKGWCGGAMPPNLKVIPTSISPELRGEKFATHWQKVCLIIERFFLKKITSTKTFTSETIETDQTDDFQREEKLIIEYIEFKEQIQDAQKVVYNAETQETSAKEEVTAHNITNKFDLLLLKLIQKSAKINLEEKDYEPIQQLTIQHPELECYAISSILNEFKKKNINNKADTSLVENILGYKPEWLHKFFLQKKAICNTEVEENGLIPFNSNIYQIQGTNLHHKVFITLSKDLKSKLENRTDFFYKKVQDTLSHCKFITANSKNITGIKAYSKGQDQVIKLKIANENFSLRATRQYIENKTGNVLIILQELQTHNNESNKPLITTRCKNFKDHPEIISLCRGDLAHKQAQALVNLITTESCLDNSDSYEATQDEGGSGNLIGLCAH